jgi:phage shock protein E
MFDFIKKLFKNDQAAKMVQQGAVIVDVRTKGEFNSGHIEGSLNIPLDILSKQVTSLKQLKKPIVTVCLSGIRSGQAKSMLAAAGLEAYNGGAWTGLKRQLQLL